MLIGGLEQYGGVLGDEHFFLALWEISKRREGRALRVESYWFDTTVWIRRGRWRGRERGVETHSFRINRGLGKSSKAVGRANAREILPAIFNGSSRRKAIRSHPSFPSPPFQRKALTSLDLGCGQAISRATSARSSSLAFFRRGVASSRRPPPTCRRFQSYSLD